MNSSQTSATGASSETLGFQAEVRQLLHLMVHSLYSNREIFLRELISNASDAADRLRFEAVSEPGLLEQDPDLKIRVSLDAEARTITVADNGIGMSRDEVVRNLGTIARSGTGEALSRMTGDQRRDANLIGQFGVGFYSAFIVADRVEVRTRRAGLPAEAGVRWASDGQGEFQVETIEHPARGTEVTLHLRDDAAEFADADRLTGLVRRYSDHIAFPVVIQGEEQANSAKALWTRPRTEISDDEYREFYKHLSHDFQDPLIWAHNKVEGKREYSSLLYVPARAPWDLWNREAPRGLKLYVKRVFIMDHADQFLPLYLRFMRGVVDSSDIALNVSRELLQQDSAVEAMQSGLARRSLELLEKLAADRPDDYRTFWKEFGRVLKEGPAEDPANGARVAKLLRFVTTRSTGDEADVSLADYLGRRVAGQDKIWYVLADNAAAARTSPHLEVFRKRGIEVLLLTDPIDEWLFGHLRGFEDVEFRDVRRGALDLGEAGKDASGDGEEAEAPPPEVADVVERLKVELKDEVAEVRSTARLTESAACLVLGEFDMSTQMRKLMQATGQALPETRPVLEINPEHPFVKRLAAEAAGPRFADLAQVLLDQARLTEGIALKEPARFVERVNRLLLAE